MEHAILADLDTITDALFDIRYKECIQVGHFIKCMGDALQISREESIQPVLISGELLKVFDAVETVKEHDTWNLYGHDAEGEKHLLLSQGGLEEFRQMFPNLF